MAMLGEKVKVMSGKHAGRIGVFVGARPFVNRKTGKEGAVIYCVALDNPQGGYNVWCQKIGPVDG